MRSGTRLLHLTITIFGALLLLLGLFRLYLTHAHGFIEIGLGIYAIASFRPRIQKETKKQQRIDQAFERENFQPDTSKELKFTGRLTKEDLIDAKLYFFRVNYLLRSWISLVIILAWIGVFCIIGALMHQHTSLNQSQILILCTVPTAIILTSRNRMILFFYKRYLSNVTQPQESDTEVVFGPQEVLVTTGSHSTKKYPSSSVVYLTLPFGLFFILGDNSATIQLPNRILSPENISDFRKMYVDLVDKAIIQRVKGKRNGQ